MYFLRKMSDDCMWSGYCWYFIFWKFRVRSPVTDILTEEKMVLLYFTALICIIKRMVIDKEVTMANLAYCTRIFHRETEEIIKTSVMILMLVLWVVMLCRLVSRNSVSEEDTASFIFMAEVRLLTSGPTYNSMQHYYTEDHYRHLHCHEDLISYSVMVSKF
jgi:hypothetical protein